LRAFTRNPETRDAVFDELDAVRGANSRLDAEVAGLREDLDRPDALEFRARWIVERLALALQASLLVRSDHPALGDAFCDARLLRERGLCFGTLPPNIPTMALIERAFPESDSAGEAGA
jgi:putative acyl-CoA dehydrogenase